ncbi:unnamed protein product [Owenia fusiformis]|uniref:Golgi-associated PDZ and coiled-coil motif-containing protein n=1 Tax=Owenia fusiformis TaxID=6347 RepID=A0A8S4Q2L7_OWEFU|nr:unnamed protein product [Owenia fusiformis]
MATVAFRWLELLEKEFDKAFVDLDLLLGEIDPEQCEITYDGRQKMTALSAAFAQLCHKAQTIFQSSAKLEAQLIDHRSDLCEVRATKTVVEKELQNLILQLHSCQIELQTVKSGHDVDSEAIKRKLESEIEDRKIDNMQMARLEAELKELKKDNHELRQYVVALQGEVYGARLAAKYLDKELAGRIQQIQLLGRDMKGSEHDKLWNQLEAEIHLHRHKTVIRACRGRSDNRRRNFLPPGHDLDALRHRQGVGEIRKVKLTKEPDEGLGMSITGGKEHGVPILISEIHPGQPADRCEGLYVGDAILSVNRVDLRNAKHAEAVQILSMQTGEIEMEVVFVAPDEDSDDGNDEYVDENGFRYRMYDEEVGSVTSEQSHGSHSNRVNGSSSSPTHKQQHGAANSHALNGDVTNSPMNNTNSIQNTSASPSNDLDLDKSLSSQCENVTQNEAVQDTLLSANVQATENIPESSQNTADNIETDAPSVNGKGSLNAPSADGKKDQSQPNKLSDDLNGTSMYTGCNGHEETGKN